MTTTTDYRASSRAMSLRATPTWPTATFSRHPRKAGAQPHR